MFSQSRPRWLRQIEIAGNRVADIVDRHAFPCLSVFSVLFLSITAWQASLKPFEYDEFFTYYISRLPSTGDITAALREPLDHHPPPFYFLTRATLSVFGDNTLAARLPAIIGFWVMCVSLFVFVSRRTSGLYGVIAMLVPCVTMAHRFALQARPYGLLLGFSGLALLAWQAAAEGRKRRLSLVGLTVALAGVISSCYYGVLVFVPLAVGELTRTLIRRKIDWPVWFAIALGGGICFAYLPFVMGSVSGFVPNNWASPNFGQILGIPYVLLRQLASGFSVFLVLVAFLLLAGSRMSRRELPHSWSGGAFPEFLTGAALWFLPVLCYVVALLVTNKMHLRYVVPMVIGLGIVVGMLCYLLGNRWPIFGPLVLLCVTGQFSSHILLESRVLSRQAQRVHPLVSMLEGVPPDIPIATDVKSEYLKLAHSGAGEFLERMRYVVDPDAAREFAEVFPAKGGLTWLKLSRFMPVNAERLKTFRRRHGEYLVYTNHSPFTFLIKSLLAEGADVRLLRVRGAHRLYVVADTEQGVAVGPATDAFLERRAWSDIRTPAASSP
jgi:hypothetical protein